LASSSTVDPEDLSSISLPRWKIVKCVD